MVGMAAKRGAKGVKVGVPGRVVEKAGIAAYKRNVPSADRNAKIRISGQPIRIVFGLCNQSMS